MTRSSQLRKKKPEIKRAFRPSTGCKTMTCFKEPFKNTMSTVTVIKIALFCISYNSFTLHPVALSQGTYTVKFKLVTDF